MIRTERPRRPPLVWPTYRIDDLPPEEPVVSRPTIRGRSLAPVAPVAPPPPPIVPPAAGHHVRPLRLELLELLAAEPPPGRRRPGR
jgi:hypothetical protein